MSEHVDNIVAQLSHDIRSTVRAAQSLGGRQSMRQVAACIEAELAALREQLRQTYAKKEG